MTACKAVHTYNYISMRSLCLIWQCRVKRVLQCQADGRLQHRGDESDAQRGWLCRTGFALMKMMGSVGSFVGPYLIGLTSDASGTFTPAMLLLAVCLLSASVMQLLFREPGTLFTLHTVRLPSSACHKGARMN